MFYKKSLKYKNQITVYKGVKYHSKLEVAYAQYLDGLLREKKIDRWERQLKVDCCVNGVHICNLIVDFLVHRPDGSHQYVEIKGLETDVYKLKYKLLKALYPTIDYVVLKYRDLKALGLYGTTRRERAVRKKVRRKLQR